jgi:hypothetical protein
MIIRNAIEYLAIILIWVGALSVLDRAMFPGWGSIGMVLGIAWAKTIFFGSENLRQLWVASSQNVPYHQFMLIMLINMSQIILSFGLDYHLLHTINGQSFGGLPDQLNFGGTVFELVYYSVLNFTFFGYGDVTPQTIPAKLLTMTEIVLAFVTVIFLLSDFISLKESLRTGLESNGSVNPGSHTSSTS